MQLHKIGLQIGLLVLGIQLVACSSLEESLQGDKIDYKSAKRGANIEVPPDLTQIVRETALNQGGGSVSASNYAADKKPNSTNSTTALNSAEGMRIERIGNQRWLVVNQPAENLWPLVREFWIESGFLLNTEQKDLGIMETDWAENRAKLPQDFIRTGIGKVFDGLYETGERDKFRTRLERSTDGKSTEIYISQRGMEEVFTSNSKDRTVWQPRAASPELEVEFLRRLMVRLGAKQEQAKTQTATNAEKRTARVIASDSTVQIDDGFDRAWRRVGLSLDRTGFTVEDRDRAQGVYFVRYVPLSADKKDGFLSSIFNRSESAMPVKYRIALKAQGETKTVVSILDATGAAAPAVDAGRIARVIADDLK